MILVLILNNEVMDIENVMYEHGYTTLSSWQERVVPKDTSRGCSIRTREAMKTH